MKHSSRPRRAPFLYQSGVHRAHRQAALHVEQACRGLGLSGPDAHLLGFIQSNQSCPMRELGRVFGHKPSTLTSILDRFESRGWARRELAEDDRRSFVVLLTARGDRVASAAREVATALERSIAGRVSPQDLAAFLRVLEAFAAATGVRVRSASTSPVSAAGRRSGRANPRTTRPNRRPTV